MDNGYERILKEGWGLSLERGIRTRTGLICHTDGGVFELRKPRGNAESIRFGADVKERLRQNGFRNVSRFRRTLEGEPFFAEDETLFVLEGLLPKESLSEETERDFLTGAELLGKMAEASGGLESTHGKWDRNRLPARYAGRRGELAKIRHRIDRRGGYDAIDLMVLSRYEEYTERIKEAEALLLEAEYSHLSEEAEKRGSFCHRAFKGENIRTDSVGRAFVAGFDRAEGEIALCDLGSYLRRYMKKTGGSAEGVRCMLDAYEKHSHISDRELLLLRALAVYPEKFLRLLNEYYNRRRVCVSPAMSERMAGAVREEEQGRRLAEFLRQLSRK